MLPQGLQHPGFILAGKAQVFIQQRPVLNDGHGQLGGLHLHPRVLGGGGRVLRIGEHGQGAVGFQNGVLHIPGIQHILLPQVAHELVQGDPGLAERTLLDVSVFNEDDRLSAENAPEPLASQGEPGQHQLQPQHR